MKSFFSNKVILITGVAGFIGSFLAKRLLEEDCCVNVIGIDNMSDYYDISLKKERLDMLSKFCAFTFIENDISDKDKLLAVFEQFKPSVVVNLAAQAGVGYSMQNPDAYINSNVIGFYNILECCRNFPVEHLVFASSSSVYGANKKVPYSVDDKVDIPVSLYAATKKTDELFAHAYSKLYKIPCTGLRFFTVYGPMGRPDMAYFKFTERLVHGKPIQIYNNGDMYRDFTYIDDIVTGIVKVMQKTPAETENGAFYKIYNIGNNHPENLLHFVGVLEQCLIKEKVIDGPGKREFLPMQPFDVYKTYADVTDLERDFNYKPSTPIEKGLAEFAAWYREYYRGMRCQ